MDNKPRCQSCGMPISLEFKNVGSNADGSFNSEYCRFCFQRGAFTLPNQTVEEMIQSSIANMTQDLKMPADQAETLARTVIPNLKRWQKAAPTS